MRVIRAELRQVEPGSDHVPEWAFLKLIEPDGFNWVDLYSATVFYEDHEVARELLRMELYLDHPEEYLFGAVEIKVTANRLSSVDHREVIEP